MGKGRDKRRVAKMKAVSKRPTNAQIKKIASRLEAWAR
jgi:hypothetical protein